MNKIWTVSLALAFLSAGSLLPESINQAYARHPDGAVYVQVLPQKGKIYQSSDPETLVIDDMPYKLAPEAKVLDSEGGELDVSALQEGVFVEFISENDLISSITVLPSGWDSPDPVTRPAASQGEIILEEGVWKN